MPRGGFSPSGTLGTAKLKIGLSASGGPGHINATALHMAAGKLWPDYYRGKDLSHQANIGIGQPWACAT